MGGTLLLEDVSQIKKGLALAAGGKMATQRVSSSLSESISTWLSQGGLKKNPKKTECSGICEVAQATLEEGGTYSDSF